LQDVLPEHLQSPCVTEEKTKENVQRKCSVGMDLMTDQLPEHNPLQLSNLPQRLYALHCIVLCVDNSYHVFLLASYPLFPQIGFALDS
jgi:hypothetical protein